MSTSRKARMLVAPLLVLAIGLASVAVAGADTGPKQPGQPATGFGSSEGYTSPTATKYVTGDGNAGTRVWWYVPSTLKNGTSAPVVVYLHGFMLLAPEIYQGHIDHLTRQGYIVIYPQFNKGGLFGLLSDTDQNQMLRRAIDATNVALGRLGTKADRSQLHLFGHSLGGLMGASWVGRGGPAVQSLTLANPSLDAGAAMPSFVRSLVRITPIDHVNAAKANTARTMVLTGDRDTIAKPAESLQLFNELVNTSVKAVHQATSDTRGAPDLVADHMTPIQDDGWMPSFLMDLFGGAGEQDALDFRFYYAGLDANLAGQVSPSFSMGTWSDGAPVAQVVKLVG